MVKKIVSPEILILNNGLKIRLLGVREKADKYTEAINFLCTKTRGQKVFLKYDSVKYDENDNLLCYAYLKNKTFLNAHLIKNGLAEADTILNYKYKSKFIEIANGRLQEVGS